MQGASRKVRKADGILTDRTNLPIAVRTADCLPIFVYDPRNRVIGILHAGWKGTRKGIVANALSVMLKKWHTKPSELIVAFGPSIRPCCYEVGKVFKRYFPNEVYKKGEKYFLDTPLVNQRQLLKAGIKKENIYDCGTCTSCSRDFFSYRRQGEQAGRMLSVMMLR